MRKVNGKVADDGIKIKDHQVQTGWGSSPAPVYFLTFVESPEMIFPSIKKLVNYS